MKAVLYGGAFDPVHLGHRFIVQEALRLLSPDVLYVVPTGLPNPGFGKHLQTSPEDRVAMLSLAFGAIPAVVVSSVELERPDTPSYLVETLERLVPDLKPRPILLVGEDQLDSFTSWYRYDEILASADLWYVPRCRRSTPLPCSGRVPAQCLMETNPFDGFSSTYVRERIGKGLSVDDLVPAGVAAYIAGHRLYSE
jgi:nicotinate-nucleotide adenylyltransferase